jgi:hypothetical protein
MKVSKMGNIMLFLGILSVMVVCAGAAPAQAKSVDVSVVVPTSVNSGAAFDGTVTIINKGNSPINLKRFFITYVVPNLVYKGPYDISGNSGIVELAPGASETRTFTLKISGAKGVAVPVMAFIQGEESWYDWNSETPTLKWKLDAVWGGLGIITVK